jgi:hypothetical protein
MQRRLPATLGLLVVLALAGCGKDDPSGARANATTVTVQRDATAGTGAGAQSGAARRSGSRDDASRKAPGPKQEAGSKKGSKAPDPTSAASRKTPPGSKGTASSGPTKKGSATKPAADAGAAPAGAGSTAPAGDDSPDARLAVVAVVRRYQKDFIDGDGDDACSLLTAAGKKQMTRGGRGRTCSESINRVLDQSRASDIELIVRTRAGIHVDDVAIRGTGASVDIGKGQALRLVHERGRWLVSDPSP